jgi:hypothetical protein
MSYLLISPQPDGVCVTIPAEGVEIQACADACLPAGTRYRVISPADLPDPRFRDAWTADFSDYDGISQGRSDLPSPDQP